MAKYKENIADNKKVEFIHVSLDSSNDAAEEWAAKEQFPWLHVLPDKLKRSDLNKFHTNGRVPFYCLVDREGKILSEGAHASFEKAKELTK